MLKPGAFNEYLFSILRQWMILNSKDHFVTMKENPKLANLKATVSEDGRQLCLSGGNMPPLQIPVVPEGTEIVKTRQVKMENKF